MKKIFFLFCIFYSINTFAAMNQQKVAEASPATFKEYEEFKYGKLVTNKALQSQMVHAQKLLENPQTSAYGTQLLRMVETAFGAFNPFADKILLDHHLKNGEQDKATQILGKLAISGNPDAQFELSKILKGKPELQVGLLKEAARPKFFHHDGRSFYYAHAPSQLALVPFYAQKKDDEALNLFSLAFRSLEREPELFSTLYQSDAFTSLKEIAKKKSRSQSKALALVKTIEMDAFRQDISSDPDFAAALIEEKSQRTREENIQLCNYYMKNNESKKAFAILDQLLVGAKNGELNIVLKKMEEMASNLDVATLKLARIYSGVEKIDEVAVDAQKALSILQSSKNTNHLSANDELFGALEKSAGTSELIANALADYYFARSKMGSQKKEKQLAADFEKKGMAFLRKNAQNFSSIQWQLIARLAELDNRQEIVSHLKEARARDVSKAFKDVDISLIAKLAQKNGEIAYELYRIYKDGITGFVPVQEDLAAKYLRIAAGQNNLSALCEQLEGTAEDKISVAIRIIKNASLKKQEERQIYEKAISFLQKHDENVAICYELMLAHARLQNHSRMIYYLQQVIEKDAQFSSNAAFNETYGYVTAKFPQCLKDLCALRLKNIRKNKNIKVQANELLNIQRTIDTLKGNKIECDDLIAVQNTNLCDLAELFSQSDGVLAEQLLTIAWEKNNFYGARMQWWKMCYTNELESLKRRIIASEWLNEVFKRSKHQEIFEVCQAVLEQYAQKLSNIDEESRRTISNVLIDAVKTKPLESLILLDRWCGLEEINFKERGLSVSLADISSFPLIEQLVLRGLQDSINGTLTPKSEILKELIESNSPEGYGFAAFTEEDKTLKEDYLKKCDALFDRLDLQKPYAKNILARIISASFPHSENPSIAKIALKAALHFPLVLHKGEAARYLQSIYEEVDASNERCKYGFIPNEKYVSQITDAFAYAPESFLLKGRLLFEKGEFLSAEKVLLNGRKLAEKNANPVIKFIDKLLSRVLVKQAGSYFDKEKKVTIQIEQLIKQAIKYYPLDAAITYYRQICKEANCYIPEKDRELMEAAALQGHADLAYDFSKLYDRGGNFYVGNEKLTVNVNRDLSRKFRKIASENGHPEATREIAVLKLIEGNSSEAHLLFKTAVKQGSEKAAWELGVELFKNQRYEDALKCMSGPFEDSLTYWRSNLFLAAMYALGKGVKQCDAEFVSKMRNCFARITSDLFLENKAYSESDEQLLRTSLNQTYKMKYLIEKHGGIWKTYLNGQLELIEAYLESNQENKTKKYTHCRELFTQAAEENNDDIRFEALAQLSKMAYYSAQNFNEEGAFAMMKASLYMQKAMETKSSDVCESIKNLAKQIGESLKTYDAKGLMTIDAFATYEKTYKAWIGKSENR